MTDFSESIILPLAEYERLRACNTTAYSKHVCQTIANREEEEEERQKDPTTSASATEADRGNSDLKLYALNRKLWEEQQTGRRNPIRVGEETHEPKFQDLLDQFESLGLQQHPILKRILWEYIRRFSDKIDWKEDTYELVIDGHVVPGTNIARVLHFLLRPETFNYRAPPGTARLKEKLVEVGVPLGWLHYTIHSNIGRRRKTAPLAGHKIRKATTMAHAKHRFSPVLVSTPLKAKEKFLSENLDTSQEEEIPTTFFETPKWQKVLSDSTKESEESFEEAEERSTPPPSPPPPVRRAQRDIPPWKPFGSAEWELGSPMLEDQSKEKRRRKNVALTSLLLTSQAPAVRGLVPGQNTSRLVDNPPIFDTATEEAQSAVDARPQRAKSQWKPYNSGDWELERP